MDRIREFLEYCANDNLTAVRSILDQGLDVDSSDEDEVTGLQMAAANGSVSVFRELIVRGAALDKPNVAGWTPLLHAARHGHTAIAALLLQNQADVNACTDLGVNAMTLAAYGGHLSMCRLLQEANIDLNLVMTTGTVCRSACEFTPLMTAAHHGNDAVIKHLLDISGSDLNYRTPSLGVNSLMLAALSGHMATAQLLVERGADPNLTNINGHTPLEIACMRGQREVQGYLDRKTACKDRTACPDIKPDIVNATKQGNIGRVKDILSSDLTQRDVFSLPDGETPLMFAAINGRLDIAQLLVECGCDINKQDHVNGWTALMQAIIHGSKAVAMYLISAGADVLIAAKNGCTAFDMVTLIEEVDTEIYRLLAARVVQQNTPTLHNTDSLRSTQSTNSRTSTDTINRNSSYSTTTSCSSKSVQFSNDDENCNKARSGVMTSRADDSLTAESDGTEEQSKTNLKGWWNRMSNRFRNLKLGRTFNLNRLGPIPSRHENNSQLSSDNESYQNRFC